MKWNPNLEVGVEIIDNQHKIIFDLAKDLNYAVLAGANMQVIDTLFSVIANFAFQHFETEEKFFKEKAGYLEHCLKHYKLIKQLHDYNIDFHNGRVVDVAPGTFLENWLTLHIRENDLPILTQQPLDLTLLVDVDGLDDFNDDAEKRQHVRLRHDKVLEEEITGYCFNASKLKTGPVSVIDLSNGGLKIRAENAFEVDDLLVISCAIGSNFRFKEKARVKNISENYYGVEFISPAKETIKFLTELTGAVTTFSRN